MPQTTQLIRLPHIPEWNVDFLLFIVDQNLSRKETFLEVTGNRTHNLSIMSLSRLPLNHAHKGKPQSDHLQSDVESQNMSRYILRLQSMSLFVILLPMTYCLYYLRCVVPYRLLLTVYGLFLSEVRYFPLFDPTVYILHIKTFAVTEDRTRESSHDECL